MQKIEQTFRKGFKKMKKLLAGLLAATLLCLAFGVIVSASGFGNGVEVIAKDAKIIKSGLYGMKITFSDADVKQALCINDFEKITVTKLPPTSDGTLMLAGRRVSEGTSIKRKNLPALVFIPTSREVSETSFKISVDGYADGNEVDFILKFTDKVNYEPNISEDYADSLALLTQKEIGVWGKMQATDAEGDAIEYIIVSYPKSGLLTIVDKEKGKYLYTPQDSYTGSDSFVYVARDEWGNFSKAQNVSITVSERMSDIEYADMIERPEYNAAVAMTAMGIMGGEIIGDGIYFNPDKAVSRAEFVAMAMKSLGIRPDSSASATYFDDDSSIPEPLRSYVATAQKKGVICGKFENGKLLFKPNDKITKYDAAVIMSELMGADADTDVTVFANESEIPTWARASVYAMCAAGIFDYEGNTIDASATVTRADCARYLYRMINLQ